MAMLSVLIGLMPAECPAQDKNDDPDQVYVFGTTVVIPSGLKGTIYYIHSAKKLNELQKEKPRGTIYTSSLNIPTQDYSVVRESRSDLNGSPSITRESSGSANPANTAGS